MTSPFLKFIRKDVQSMHAYTVQPSAGMIKLDAMENPFPLPASLQKALGERLGQVAINRYPGQRVEDLKTALSQHIQMPKNHALMLGNGSDELISLLAMACNIPEAKILAPEPGFVMYAMSAQFHGVFYVGVPLTPAFELDEVAMTQAIVQHQPVIVYLAYPNNPTANLWDAAVMRRLIAHVSAYGGFVVIDEAYQPFSSRTWMDEIKQHPQANQQVLLMRTLSKFGLAGVRLGYMCGHADIIHQIDKLRPPYNISVLNSECALFALENQTAFAEQAKLICDERQKLIDAIQKLSHAKAYPSQANMILVRFSKDSLQAQSVFEQLQSQRILVKNVSKMHPLLLGCLRLTVGTPSENAQLIQALQYILGASS